jgi:hypothetical protein
VKLRDVPLACVLLGLASILVATRLYPDFDWSRHYVTNLFRPLALNGQPNIARPYAIAGMWLFCLGVAELFRQLASAIEPAKHATWVRIFGIAGAVYAAFTVTRMHDLMVTISIGFFVAAEIVLLDWVWRRRRRPEWMAGAASLALLLLAAFAYYRQVATVILPLLQKLVFLSSSGWLLWLQRQPGAKAQAAAT